MLASAFADPARNGPARDTTRYASYIGSSPRARGDVAHDVIRGRSFDFTQSFLPDALSRISRLDFLQHNERCLLSQVQARTYARMFNCLERMVCTRMLEICHDDAFGNQVVLEALVRYADKKLGHQWLFRRIDQMIGVGLPAGYEFVLEPHVLARIFDSTSAWAVLALTCQLGACAQVHHERSSNRSSGGCALYADVLRFRRIRDSAHPAVDALEWERVNARLKSDDRDEAVLDFVDAIAALNAMVQAQAGEDANYFLRVIGRSLSATETRRVASEVLRAYRWQFIVSGLRDTDFSSRLGSMLTPSEQQRIHWAIAPLVD
jgi:hypothetical protein